MFYISVLNFTWLLSICVELALSVVLVIRVLKCFVTPTLTYTAQVDESVLHICFEFHSVAEYMRWTCTECTASDWRLKMVCYADFNIYRSSRRKCHWITEYMRWTCIECTASDLRFKMLCYADLNIYGSSRRKRVTYLFWISLGYWVYALNLRYKYCERPPF